MVGLRRLLIDYDSTLNPGQGNQPITPERAALLTTYLTQWRALGVDVYVLTASNPVKKVEGLEAAGIRDLFNDVLSSTLPKKFATKGDFIARRVRDENWVPCEQLLADDSIEAIQSIWQDEEGARKGGPLAHTLRLLQHSQSGLLEADLQMITARIKGPVASATTHCYASEHGNVRFVDEGDSPAKCMIDSLPSESRGQVIRANPEAQRREWLDRRPDLAALCPPGSVTDQMLASNVEPTPKRAAVPWKAPAPQADKGKGKGKGKVPATEGKGMGKGTSSAGAATALAIDLAPFHCLVARLEAAAASFPLQCQGSSNVFAPRARTSPTGSDERLPIDFTSLDALVSRMENVTNRLCQ